MREDEARLGCGRIEEVRPCLKVLGLFNGVGVLRERKLPVPAWTVPAEAWVIYAQCPRSKAIHVLGKRGRDDALCGAIYNAVNAKREVKPISGKLLSLRNPSSGCRACPIRQEAIA